MFRLNPGSDLSVKLDFYTIFVWIRPRHPDPQSWRGGGMILGFGLCAGKLHRGASYYHGSVLERNHGSSHRYNRPEMTIERP